MSTAFRHRGTPCVATYDLGEPGQHIFTVLISKMVLPTPQNWEGQNNQHGKFYHLLSHMFHLHLNDIGISKKNRKDIGISSSHVWM